MDKIRKKKFVINNYSSVYFNGKTMRFPVDPSKEVTELEYPEFYDVKITNKCNGNCQYCYQSSTAKDNHFDNILTKVNNFFGKLTENQKPFQVAIGGGNPNEHPDFVELLELFNSLNITPNYTTNGQGLTSSVIDATLKYCGGVAISCHPHLKYSWSNAIKIFHDKNIKINLHLIISNDKSVDNFLNIFNEFKDKIDYVVLLPYIKQGRAKVDKTNTDEKLLKALSSINYSDKIAFGANYYNFLMKNKKCIKVSLYAPEMFSKYLDLSDMSIHKSSFNLN